MTPRAVWKAFFVLFCLVSMVEGRGGGGGASGGTGGGGGYGGDGDLTLVWVIIGGLFICVCIGAILVDKRITWIPCYLCCENISIKTWDTHRKSCAVRNKETLAMRHPLNTSISSRCGKCSGYLRQWTSYRMKERPGNNTFICDIHHSNLHAKKRYKNFETVNTDNNRFNCFVCDYDVCDACARLFSVSKKL